MAKRKNPPPDPVLPVVSPEDLTILRAAGVNDHELGALLEVRRRYESGGYREISEQTKRLEFLRWLVQNERLSS